MNNKMKLVQMPWPAKRGESIASTATLTWHPGRPAVGELLEPPPRVAGAIATVGVRGDLEGYEKAFWNPRPGAALAYLWTRFGPPRFSRDPLKGNFSWLVANEREPRVGLEVFDGRFFCAMNGGYSESIWRDEIGEIDLPDGDEISPNSKRDVARKAVAQIWEDLLKPVEAGCRRFNLYGEDPGTFHGKPAHPTWSVGRGVGIEHLVAEADYGDGFDRMSSDEMRDPMRQVYPGEMESLTHYRKDIPPRDFGAGDREDRLLYLWRRFGPPRSDWDGSRHVWAYRLCRKREPAIVLEITDTTDRILAWKWQEPSQGECDELRSEMSRPVKFPHSIRRDMWGVLTGGARARKAKLLFPRELATLPTAWCGWDLNGRRKPK